MNTLINLKNNLIQNFYIIGLSPEDFFYINDKEEGEFLNIFENKEKLNLKSKIISKFPPNNSNFNEINDEIIINHCFPNGLSLTKSENNEINSFSFYFELDNLLVNYSPDEKNIHSKMYFTCLVIFEHLNNYLSYKEDITTKLGKTMEIKKESKDKRTESIFENIYIPKVICLASVLPFYRELKEILNIIYKCYLEPNNSLRLEKLIEQIVLKIPIPFNSELRIQVSFDSNKIKEKIIFPLYKIQEENLKLSYTNSLKHIFLYFSVEDIITILKCILLELPILFFCDKKNILTSILEGFITLISPFKYVHPFISILPRNLFGFISVENKFIFGINENYQTNFFKVNEIEIESDKNIIIAYIEGKQGKIGCILNENNDNNILEIEEDKNLNKNLDNNYIDNYCIMYNGTKTELRNIELPSEAKKKLVDDLTSYATKKKGLKENVDIGEFNHKIRTFFYKFFIYILSGYTDYILNSKYFSEAYTTKNCGFELLFKDNKEKNINNLNFVKEIFNFDEFVNKSDNPSFYFAFCQTKLFLNFLRERIYLNEKNISMKYRQFDQFCFLKKHKEYRKRKENKGIYESYKKLENYESKQDKITEIKITKDDFNEIEKEQINNKINSEILIKYGQNITIEKGKYVFKYYIFPKLLFDDEFFETKYENLFFMHGIEMPSSKIIDEYKRKCSLYSGDYYKQRSYMFPPALIEKLPSSNNSKANFVITSYYYIYYDWIILLCCSLWYCEPVERIVRLDEILIVLDKLYYIEEIVVKLCFNTFIKYGNKMQCIQAYEKLMKFYGYSNYFYLNLLNNKLCQEEEIIYDEYINNKEYMFKDRSLILNLDSFIQKRVSKSNKNDNISFRNTMFNLGTKTKMSIIINKKEQESNYKERILFSSEQFCKKCKCYNSFDFEEIKKQKLSKINYKYKCIKCKTFKDEVYIKYQLLLYNKKRDELYITKMGEFKLLPPNRLYKELMFNLTSQKNWEINIDNIMNEVTINLMNFLFYFSIEELSFDFLIPFKKLSDENIELIQNNLCKVICDINKKRFGIFDNIESNDINKGLVENIENENFIPIDISNSDNFDKYFDLIPCLIDNDEEDYLGENNNQNENESDNIVNKSTNYFTING